MKKYQSEESILPTESVQQSYSPSERLRAVALSLENLIEGKKINEAEQEACTWGALFLESLYHLKMQKDQELFSLVRTYAGAFYLRLEQANIPLQDAYGKRVCAYLRNEIDNTMAKNNFSPEELKNLRRAFLSCADVAEWAHKTNWTQDPD